MGTQRDCVWRETGIVEKLPINGPTVLWRTNVNRGYVGPAVVGNRSRQLLGLAQNQFRVLRPVQAR